MADNIFSGGKSARNEISGPVITIDLGFSEDTRIWTASEAETINVVGSQIAGRELFLMITNNGILPQVITFGTGFRSTGTVTGILGKLSIIYFISDGTNFCEKSRVLGL